METERNRRCGCTYTQVMPRVAHHHVRGAVGVVLAVVMLLVGVLAGVQSASAPDHVGHPDVHRAGDADLGAPAVTQRHWATHPQRPDAHASGVMAPRRASSAAWFPVVTSSPHTVRVRTAYQVPLRGRAPPA